jgi:2-keto-4-pentenoate hydratase
MATPAQALAQAYRRHARLEVTPDVGPADAEAAYAVQREVWRALVGDQRPTAWKVGAASPETEPLAAPMFPRHMAASPAIFSSQDFFSLGVEAEIAFRFGRDLPARAAPYRRAEILDALAGAHVALELVDTRLADAQASGPLWRLADNLLNGGFVLGNEIPGWRDLDFSGLTARILANDALVVQTLGRPPLDDLFHCLPWWIGHVGGVRAGDMVITGAWNGMHPVGLPASVEVEFLAGEERLGRAEVNVR